MNTTYPATQATRADVVRLAREVAHRHAPFAFYARGPVAFDCIGMVIDIGLRLGLFPEDLQVPEYCFPPSPKPFRAFAEYCVEKSIDDLEEGDIVIIGRMGKLLLPRHCVIAAKDKGHWNVIGILMEQSRPYTSEFLFTPDLWERVWKVYAYKGI